MNHETDLDWSEIADILGIKVSADHLRKTAYGLIEYDNYIHNQGNEAVATTILSISDMHVPFQLPIDLLRNYKGVDILQINGDVIDCYSISKFSKQYRISPMEEIIQGRQYLIDLIEYLQPKRVICNYGNHDLRLRNYLSKNLDTDILELMPDTSLELIFKDGFKHYDKRAKSKIAYEPLINIFPDIEIEYIDNWFCQIGDTVFCHPLAYSSGMLKTAEKAMSWFRNEGYNFRKLIMAHTHRSGQYTIGNTTIYEQGAFCDVKKNDYSDGRLMNSQKEGFIYLCQNKDGETIDEKTKLVVLN